MKTAIRVGDVDYSIDVSKIPYLASFVKLQKAAQPETTEFIHDPIPLFDVALKGIESGYRQCFRSLPADLSQHRILCETYKFLKVDVLNGLFMDEIIANLKAGRTDHELEYKRYRPITGNKPLARDTAFQLLFLMLHGQFEDEVKDGVKLFNAVEFVVSHSGTFKYLTRRVIRTAHEERFALTAKQKARLDRWEKGEDASYEEDVSTEEEPDYYFDSDDSFLGSW